MVHGEQHGIYPTEFLNTLSFLWRTTPWTALARGLSHHIITQHDQRPG
jgi:hypothetical protein